MRLGFAMMAAACLVTPMTASAADESIAFGVSDYTTAGSCYADEGDITYADDMAAAWDARFDGWVSSSQWYSSEKWINAQVDDDDFIDPTDNIDPYGLDHADVGFYIGHGTHSCTSTTDSSTITFGDAAHGVCSGKVNDFELGNGDMEIFVNFACQGVQLCVWESGSYDYMDAPSGDFAVYLGFHGNSYSGWWEPYYLDSYVNASYSSGLGDNWIDNFYVPDRSGSFDQCPTGIVWGPSAASRNDYFANGGWADRRSQAATDASSFYYVDGCDPSDGEPL